MATAVVAGETVALPSFDSFVDDEYKSVLGLVTAVYGRRDPEDIVQEAFLRAHAQWRLLLEPGVAERWVRRVALNLAVSRYRRWKAEARALGRLSARRETTTILVSSDTAEVWDQVRRLPARQAQVIALRYVEALPVSKIAGILGLAEGTVRALLYQGRRNLAHCLQEELDPSLEEDQR